MQNEKEQEKKRGVCGNIGIVAYHYRASVKIPCGILSGKDFTKRQHKASFKSYISIYNISWGFFFAANDLFGEKAATTP